MFVGGVQWHIFLFSIYLFFTMKENAMAKNKVLTNIDLETCDRLRDQFRSLESSALNSCFHHWGLQQVSMLPSLL